VGLIIRIDFLRIWSYPVRWRTLYKRAIWIRWSFP